ncbi:hypothetical protein D3C79_970800 [compost metagenome]
MFTKLEAAFYLRDFIVCDFYEFIAVAELIKAIFYGLQDQVRLNINFVYQDGCCL